MPHCRRGATHRSPNARPRAGSVRAPATAAAAALAFYRALKLEIAAGEEHSPHVELDLAGYHMGFSTEDLTRKGDLGWVQPVGQRVTPAFKLDMPDEADALYARMTAAGYAGLKAPWDTFWGQRYAFLQDPDHNRVDVFAPLLAEHPLPQ